MPNSATGIAANATAVNPTASSYVSFYPADADPRPTASNLNVVAGAAPTPNQVTVGLSGAGAIGVFNNGGTVDLVVDIGYYQAASTGGAGAQGPQGVPGPSDPANRIGDHQIALLRWDQDPGRAGVYATGATPLGSAYDGTSIWVANYGANTVSKINSATGTKVDYPTGILAKAVTFDGTDVWIANSGSNNVSKIRSVAEKFEIASGQRFRHHLC